MEFMSRQFYRQFISHRQKYNSQLNMLTKRKELNTEILIILHRSVLKYVSII